MMDHHRYHRHHYKSQQMLVVLALVLIGTSTTLTLTSAALVPLPSPVSTLSLSSLVSTKSRTNSNRDTGTVTSTSTSSTTSSNLYMYQYPDYEYDPDQIRKPKPRPVLERTQTTATKIQTQTQTKTSTPTQVESEAEPQPTKPHNPKPKIIVLGATGKIGQHIIRNLMSCKQEMNIVAFVRDYDKACEVLYEDLIREQNTNSGLNKNKPTLTLMVMDLVPDSEVAGYEKRKKMARIQKNKNRKERRRRKVYKNYYEDDYELEEIDDDDDDDDDEYDDDDDDDDDNDNVNSKYAQSAAKFYKEDVSKYDYRRKTKDKYDIIDPYQPLYDAMKNATAVISTIGTIRETIPFVDYIVKPWRIFRTADKWCDDPTHPYYVNYMVMKKVLDCAEKEQIRRDNEWKAWEESQAEEDENEDADADVNNGKDIDTDSDTDENNIEIKTAIDIDMNKNIENNKNDKKDKKQGERIRIIRISDLCVANPPWDIVSVFTNIVRSLVFLSQEKCENLLQSSDIVDTIVLRPGDLVNERRIGSDGDSDSDHSFENDVKEKDFHSENNISKDNVNMNVNEVNMSLEVDVNGYLPSPSYIGREDVAGVAALASVSTLEPNFKRQQRNNKNNNNSAAQNITGIMQHEGRQRRNTNTRGMMRRRRNNKNNNDMKKGRKKAKHWNVAVGWTDKKVPVPATATVAAVSSKNSNEQYLNNRKQHDSLQKAFQYIVKEEHKKSKVENRKVTLQQDANPLTKLILRPMQKRLRQFHIQQTKPYGIFVLLPMIFLVYPMICSIMFSIGKKIPGVELAAMKILSILKPMFLMWMQRMQLSSAGKAIMSRSRDPNQLKKLIY